MADPRTRSSNPNPGRQTTMKNMIKDLRAIGYGTWCIGVGAVAYGALVYIQAGQFVDAVATGDRSTARWSVIGLVAMALGVMVFAKLFGSSLASDVAAARRARIEARAEVLATGGSMSSDELRQLATAARKARDFEEAEALDDAARMVDRKEAERARDKALADLKAANEAARIELDNARAYRTLNAPSAFDREVTR